ncbi:hypothetical protein FQN60_009270, partial [Etheostoma spectabile]
VRFWTLGTLWTARYVGNVTDQLSTPFNQKLRFNKIRMSLTQVSSNKCAGGFQKVFEHESTELKCKMKFAVYLPPKAETDKCPVMYWLSGLTCTEQNFITKAGSQIAAAEHGIIIVAPDTSPRGCNIEGEDENWDFGTGAGFYLPELINANFPTDPARISVSGHSMGGHGALICALKNPGKRCLRSLPSVTRCSVPGAYDATVLAASYSGPQLDVLIDQGRDDQFLSASQLLPDNLIAVCSEKKIPVVFRLQPGYDHSYFFIYSFINDHIKHHAKFLNA